MKPRHTAEQSTVKVNKAETIAAGSGAPKKGFGAAAGSPTAHREAETAKAHRG